MLPERWDRPLALYLPLHVARWLVFGNRGVATEDTADLKGTGQLMHPMEEWLCPGKGRWKAPRRGKELVNILTMTTLGLGESHWCKVESASDDSTLVWSCWKIVVIKPRLPSSTPSVIKTSTGAISSLIFQPLANMNSTLAIPYIDGNEKWVKSLSDTIWNWMVPREGSSQKDFLSSSGKTLQKSILKDLLIAFGDHQSWHLARRETLLGLFSNG